MLRALEHRPEVLLLDEPTGPLDEASTAAVEGLLREKQANGLALLWVTHDKRQAERIAERRFWIERTEEHTSELQSLMRISYAVFCLKKKTNKIHKDTEKP